MTTEKLANLTKEQYLIIREEIRKNLKELSENTFSNSDYENVKRRYKCTAYHQIYNYIKGKKSSHDLSKSHQDVWFFNETLKRIQKELIEHLVESESQEVQDVSCTT